MTDFLNTQLHALISQLQHLLQHNELAQGGLLLGALGALAAAARSWPHRLWGRLLARATFTLEIDGQDQSFAWLSVWLAAQAGSRRMRHMGVATRFNESMGGLALALGTDQDGDEITVRLIPLSGQSLMRYRGHWILVRPSREKNQSEGQRMLGYTHTLSLQMLGRSRHLIGPLLQDAYEATAGAVSGQTEIYTPEYQNWQVSDRRRSRPPGSLIYGGTLMDTLLADVGRFQSDREWYQEMGIPYRRGYLLHGPPGNGKSSLVAAVAGAMGLNICVLNLATPELSDERLQSLLSNLPRRALLLLEDIDAVFVGRERRTETVKLSFAGLLNALDGVAAGEGRVCFLTTNHPEHLDPALVRPGRADLHLHVANASREQVAGMLERFFPQGQFTHFGAAQRLALAGRVPEGHLSMARLQEYLLERRGDPLRTVRDWEELCGPISEQEPADSAAKLPAFQTPEIQPPESQGRAGRAAGLPTSLLLCQLFRQQTGGSEFTV
ncbi:AAA family ATPase [Deinococcus altitudinis]|uniref:AAA family ATPase n=1 Tax=Deinococcus altitudinis TaxID=468914 RepID=UPI0038915DED